MIRSFADDSTRDIWNGVNSKAARRIPKELWPALLEKAFAVRAGSYGAIESGVPGEALESITGRATTDVPLLTMLIVARTTHLHSFHSVRLLNNIDEYFTEPSPARWDLAKGDLLFMSLSLTDLLEEIARLDPTYRIQPTSWQGPLRERRVLERLAAIQPPATRQELTEFSRVRVQYTLLVRHLQQVNDGVDDYIGSGSRR